MTAVNWMSKHIILQTRHARDRNMCSNHITQLLYCYSALHDVRYLAAKTRDTVTTFKWAIDE